MLKRLISLLSVALLALVVLAACGGDDEPEDVARVEASGAPDFPIADSHPGGGTPAAGGGGGVDGGDDGGDQPPAQALTLTAQGIARGQSELTIPANTPVPITLVNADRVEHNFTVEGQDVAIDMPGGQTIEGELNLPAGTYTFVCTIPGHEALMTGTLTVTEGAAAPAEQAGGQTGGAGGQSQAPQPAGGGAAAPPVTLTAQGTAWDQTELTIPAGTEVPFTLVNADPIEHNFTVEDTDFAIVMPGSQTVNATINLPAGSYTFVCTVPGHEALMTGTLTVQ